MLRFEGTALVEGEGDGGSRVGFGLGRGRSLGFGGRGFGLRALDEGADADGAHPVGDGEAESSSFLLEPAVLGVVEGDADAFRGHVWSPLVQVGPI